MSVTSAEYISDMKEVIEKLESWLDWNPELEDAIKIIKESIEGIV